MKCHQPNTFCLNLWFWVLSPRNPGKLPPVLVLRWPVSTPTALQVTESPEAGLLDRSHSPGSLWLPDA